MKTTFWRAVGLVAIAALAGCITPLSRRTGPFHPQKPGYAYEAGQVTLNGKPVMQVIQTDVDNYTTHYRVKSADQTDQVEVTLASSYENTLECRASFPTLGTHYEIRIPVLPFTDLLASFIDHDVLVDGKVNQAGLNAYAASKGIKLVNTGAQIQRMQTAAQLAECRKCKQDFRICLEGRGGGQACATAFQTCSQGGILTRPADWPCGPPAPE